MNQEICQQVFRWVEENLEALRRAARGHGDFYRVDTAQMLKFAESSAVPVKDLLILAEAHGYYHLLMQVPAVKAVKEMTQSFLPLPCGGEASLSLSEMFFDLRLWCNIYKASIGERHEEVNQELVDLFQEKILESARWV